MSQITNSQVVAAAKPPVGSGSGPLDLGGLRALDEVAWSRAFRQLWPVALHAARHPSWRLTSTEAEDVAGYALESLAAQIDRVATPDGLRALTVTIARCRAVSLVRAKAAAKRGPAPLPLDGWSGQEPPDAIILREDDQASELDRAELLLLMERALLALDAETRALLKEKIMDGASYRELSVRHGMPMGTICTKVARGLARVQDQLKDSPRLMQEMRAFLR